MEKLHEYLPGDSRERIQDLLIERKMTQAQLAEKLEISESSLSFTILASFSTVSSSTESKILHIAVTLFLNFFEAESSVMTAESERI